MKWFRDLNYLKENIQFGPSTASNYDDLFVEQKIMGCIRSYLRVK